MEAGRRERVQLSGSKQRPLPLTTSFSPAQKYVMRVTPLFAGLTAGVALLTAAACTSIKPSTFANPTDTGPRTATVAFYNLENLFDT